MYGVYTVQTACYMAQTMRERCYGAAVCRAHVAHHVDSVQSVSE